MLTPSESQSELGVKRDRVAMGILERQREPNKEDTSIITSIGLGDGFAHSDGRVVIGLRTAGCSWARKRGGGCTHCRIPFSEICSCDSREILPRFTEEFFKYDYKEYPVLCLYTPGSFFDDEELLPCLRNRILEFVSRETDIKTLSVESRPDFITEENIAMLRDMLPDKRIEVSLGLDSANDKVRNLFLNKGLRFENYLEACAILNKYKMIVVTYVLVKPPFLSESNAIFDAVQTARTAFECGSSIVSLEPMNVQRNTVVYHLYNCGLYRPPWLWTVIAIAREVHRLGCVRIGQFVYPPAVKYPSNCRKCTQMASKAIQVFNRSGEIKGLENLFCDCQAEWEKELQNMEVIRNGSGGTQAR